MTYRTPLAACTTLLALAAGPAAAQTDAPARSTLEAVATGSQINAGLPDGHALNLRGTLLLGGDDLLRAELLDERKFGARGGLVGVGFAKGLAPDWFVSGNVSAGHGGVNWANQRWDLALATKLGAQREHIVQLAGYHAGYDGARSDRGLGLSLVSYATAPLVLQVGATLNVSDPGAVHSTMFSASGTWGHEGQQYISLRVAAGREGYQAIGSGRPLLADFASHSIGLNWRRWLGPRWGISAQLEHYRNPSYERLSLGAGVFSQW